MGSERASLGFSDALEDFNPAEWAPAGPVRANRAEVNQAVSIAAAAAGFRSREPKPEALTVPGPDPLVRRRRTGRNAQFNLKARPETIAAFCAIADRQGWGLGETLERAVDLLESQLSPKL